MSKQYFITGTDTEVGKTTIASGILKAATEQGLSSLGLKPVAAGCELIDGMWKNEDALQLMDAASVTLSYEQINPITLQAAIAPHIAAAQGNVDLVATDIAQQCRDAMLLIDDGEHQEYLADLVLIEGAGGWLVPLNEKEFFSDIAVKLKIPIILIVGIRLGCINHALLTAQAIVQSGLQLAGWVANCIDPNTAVVDDNISTLKNKLAAPCLGVVPFISTHDLNESPTPYTISGEVPPYLDIKALL